MRPLACKGKSSVPTRTRGKDTGAERRDREEVKSEVVERTGQSQAVVVVQSKSCPAVCDPMNWSTRGFPVPHHLLEFAQVHVHRIGDAVQPSHPLSSLSSAFNLSQHQGLFQWVSCLHQVAKVLELQHQSFQWVFRVDFLLDWLVWSPCCPRDSQESLL